MHGQRPDMHRDRVDMGIHQHVKYCVPNPNALCALQPFSTPQLAQGADEKQIQLVVQPGARRRRRATSAPEIDGRGALAIWRVLPMLLPVCSSRHVKYERMPYCAAATGAAGTKASA
jgi:hypothetical protein